MGKKLYRRHDLDSDADFIARLMESSRAAVARKIHDDIENCLMTYYKENGLETDYDILGKVDEYFEIIWDEKYQEDSVGPTDW